jgi:hypothetical protein
MLHLVRENLEYQAFYCEENIWKLLARPELAGWDAWAVMVTNQKRNVPMLRQRAGRPVDGLVHWDYHVFAAALDPEEGAIILDLDTQLPFPCALEQYLEDTLPPGSPGRATARFRLIRADEYIARFSSDRSHMRRADGSWIEPPPPWPAPGSDRNEPSNLMLWLDVKRRSPGKVLSFDRFLKVMRKRSRAAMRRLA